MSSSSKSNWCRVMKTKAKMYNKVQKIEENFMIKKMIHYNNVLSYFINTFLVFQFFCLHYTFWPLESLAFISMLQFELDVL